MPVNVNVGVKALTPYTQRMNQLLEEINNSEAQKRTKDVQVIRDLINNFQSATNINRTPTAVELMTGNKNVQQPAAQVDPLKTLEDFNEQRKAQRMKLAEYEDMVAQDEITKKAMADEVERQKQEAINKRIWESGEKSLDRASREKLSTQATDRYMAMANMRNNMEFLKMQAENAKANTRMTFDAEQGKLNREWKGGESDKDRALREAQIKETERKNKEYEEFLKEKAKLDQQKYDWMTGHQSRQQDEIERKNREIERLKREAEGNKVKKQAKGKILPANTVMGLAEGSAAFPMMDELERIILENEKDLGPVVGIFNAYLNPYSKVQIIKALTKDITQTAGKFKEGGVLKDQDWKKFSDMLPQVWNDPSIAIANLKQAKYFLENYMNERVRALRESGYDTSAYDNRVSIKKTESELDKARRQYRDPKTPQKVKENIKKIFGNKLGV